MIRVSRFSQMNASTPIPGNRPVGWRVAALAALALIAAAVGAADLGTDLSLRPGETVDVDERLALTFVGVTRDSRCPAGVQCRVAGEAVVVFEARCADAEAELTFEVPRETTQTFEGYEITVTAVEPHPKAGKRIEPEDYVARFVVERS